MSETNTQTNASPLRIRSDISPSFDSETTASFGQGIPPQETFQYQETNQDFTQIEDTLIDINYLNVTYNKGKSNEFRALENVNLKINSKEYVIIFGPSGCGKSTLLYAISGLLKPTSGDIKVDNELISTFNKKQVALFHRKKIGMIFQSFYLIPSLSVLDNVVMPKVFESEDVVVREQMARVLLERFGINEQANRFPSELSGGQKQRVSIARALINNPDIILADEPVGNLDSKSAYNVMNILKDLNSVDKKTVILVTHDPAHLQFGDKIIHMKDGKIIKIELVKKKVSPLESYILKDGKINPKWEEKLIKEEHIPDDLRLLMKAFRDLSLNQIGAMLVPFKAQQLFSHVFFTMTNDQIEIAKKRLQEVLFSGGDFEEFTNQLDMGVERGGAGWDRRYAETFAENVKRIMTQAQRINFSEMETSARGMAEYINHLFRLRLNSADEELLAQLIYDRFKNKIGVEELQKIIDIAKDKGGLGLDRRTSQKVAREIEIVLLLRYSV